MGTAAVTNLPVDTNTARCQAATSSVKGGASRGIKNFPERIFLYVAEALGLEPAAKGHGSLGANPHAASDAGGLVLAFRRFPLHKAKEVTVQGRNRNPVGFYFYPLIK